MNRFPTILFLLILVFCSARATAQPPNHLVVAAAVSPHELLSSAEIRQVVATAARQTRDWTLPDYCESNFGVRLEDIQRVEVLIDRDTLLKQFFIDPPSTVGGPGPQVVLQNIRSIGSAIEDYSQRVRKYPEIGGSGSGKGNLSWRVHLLPYLGLQPLHKQFKLDQPWDSEHNRKLISQMPGVFAGKGLPEGHTCVHTFSGAGTVMGSGLPIRPVDVEDYSIDIAISGSDKADIWTKPGGLPLNPGGVKETLGNVGKSALVHFQYGLAHRIDSSMDAKSFCDLCTVADGNQVIPFDFLYVERPRLPTLILKSKVSFDQPAFLKGFQSLPNNGSKTLNGSTVYLHGDYAVLFPDSTTCVVTNQDLIGQLYSAKGMLEPKLLTQLREQFHKDELTVLANFESLGQSQNQLAALTPLPGIFQAFKQIEGHVSIDEACPVLRISSSLKSEASAVQLSAVLNGLIQMQKTWLALAPQSSRGLLTANCAAFFGRVCEQTVVKVAGNRVSYEIPAAARDAGFYRRIGEGLSAMDQANEEAYIADEAMFKLRSIAHGMHSLQRANFLPISKDRPARSNLNTSKLSWRVHMLPELGQVELYKKFRLNESWDSEHNRKLISQIPHEFQPTGVKVEEGKTCIHVFLGAGTPFANSVTGESAARITNGVSSTIMFVRAGQDKAEYWTKPGGIVFKPGTGTGLLGNIGRNFFVAMYDASARMIPANIDTLAFDNMVKHRGGN